MDHGLNIDLVTSEADTGRRWVDGSVIYRKIIDMGAMPYNTFKSVAHGITDIEWVIDLWGIANNPTTGSSKPLPRCSNTTSKNADLYADGTNINLVTGNGEADWAQYSAYVFIEYIKTTDTSSSSSSAGA